MPILHASSATPKPTQRIGWLHRMLPIALGIALFQAAPMVAASTIEEASQSFKSGQHAKALEQVDKFLSGKPKDAQGRFLKGIILTSLNKQNDAISIFRKLTEDYPELPEPYNNLAVIYAQQKQYDKAKEALEQAIRTHPAYATAHENLGDIYSRLASQAYGKALQLDSSNASAQTKLAMINDLVGGGGTSGGKVGVTEGNPRGTGKMAATQPAATPAPTVVASAKPPEPRPVESKPNEPKPADTRPVDVKPAPVVTAPAKPEPKVEAKPEVKGKGAGNLESDVTAAVDAWLAAWSGKDVKTYLSFYAKDFETPGNQSRKDWEAERTLKVGKPGKIEVSRDKLNIRAEGEDKAVVRFRQNYKSTTFSSGSGKVLLLVRREGKWLIQQERVGG